MKKGKCQADANMINLAEYPQLEVCIRSALNKIKAIEKETIEENIQSMNDDQKTAKGIPEETNINKIQGNTIQHVII